MVGAIERRVVLGVLLEAAGPVTASQVSRRLSLDPEHSRRALSALESYGQARSLLALDGGPALFVAAERPEREYVRCPVCGAVEAVVEHPLEPLRRRLRERLGQELRLSRFLFAWTCEPCVGQADRAGAMWPWVEGPGESDGAVCSARARERSA